jgi:hypothetical protein
MFGRLSYILVHANSKFTLLFQKMAETRDFGAVKVYQEDHFEGAALSKQ